MEIFNKSHFKFINANSFFSRALQCLTLFIGFVSAEYLVVPIFLLLSLTTQVFGSTLVKTKDSTVKDQISSSLQILKSSEVSYWRKRQSVTQLMNLCKSIGQAQTLLVQTPIKNLKVEQRHLIIPNLDLAISELHKACDGSSKLATDQLLKKANILTLRAEVRLTQIINYLSSPQPHSHTDLIQAQNSLEVP